MKVGTICKLKVKCLSNEVGTLGVVFYDYGDGVQVIFENGNYDGFSTSSSALAAKTSEDRDKTEAEQFLEEVGFEESLAGYQFKNVTQVSADYRKGLFNIAWSEKWQGDYEPFGKEADEKCKVYADASPSHWLRFKRDNQCCMLSAAKDYADFSHFEYADLGKSLEPRWMQAGKTIYPQFVVFHKQK